MAEPDVTWRVYCIPEATYYDVVAPRDQAPTTCPADPAHAIDPTATSIRAPNERRSSAWHATRPPTVFDDVTRGYLQGSLWINTLNQRVYICTANVQDAARWVEITVGAGVGTDAPSGDISFFWADGARTGILVQSIDWKTYGVGVFVGTNFWTPDVFKIAAKMMGVGTGNIRFMDVTNNQQIFYQEVTQQVVTIFTGGLANLPAPHAILELQAKRSSANMEMYAAGMFNQNPE